MDKNDKIWQTFVEYRNLIGAESREMGLDIFGTDQITNMAISLTQAHFINELNKNMKSLFVAESEIKGEC
jgi:hypothetical protein|tara:strand:- start:1488 stop:1697 length:210 start_codon:yes stop_codon:yes gene_type:complete